MGNEEKGKEQSASCVFVVCVQGDSVQWDRAAYATSTMKRHNGGADMAVVYMDDVPSDSKGAICLKDAVPSERFVKVDGELERRVKAQYALHKKRAFAPIIIAKMFLPSLPQLSCYERIVLFDADTEALSDVTALMEIPVPTGIGGVVDQGIPTWDARSRHHDFKQDVFKAGNMYGKKMDDPYFNVGLLVFDRKTLPHDYLKRVEAALETDTKGQFWDIEQFAFNLVFNVSPLPGRFNQFAVFPNTDGEPVVNHYVTEVGKTAFDKKVRRWLGKRKVVVYAIACDEAHFAERWMNSMKEADAVVVLDTGSTDGTPEILRSLGAKVGVKRYARWKDVEEYKRLVSEWREVPFRFDWARNDSLDFAKSIVPDADILVCTDLDEVFLPGWRGKLEEAWARYEEKKGSPPTTAQYQYVWSFNPDGTDGKTFHYDKVHAPGFGRWAHPCHEVIEYRGQERRCVFVEGMRLEHHPDPMKSRGSYLSMLELAVAENPDNDRDAHYLGREYMFCGRWDDAIRMLRRHLEIPSATWLAERAASMRYIAKCYAEKGDQAKQEIWLRRGVMEAPEQRESALDLAELMHSQRDWPALVRACEACLAVKNRIVSCHTSQQAWGSRPHDLYSIGLWYTGRREEAIRVNEEAMRLSPDDKRLRENDALMRRLMSKE